MLIHYKDSSSSSTSVSKSNSHIESIKDTVLEKNNQDILNAINFFFNSLTPIDSINQIKTIILALGSGDIKLKTYILSFNFMPRIIALINSFDFSNPNEFKIEVLFPIIEFIDVIISDNPQLKNPNTLQFCFLFLDEYFKRKMFPNYLPSIHFLMRCFLDHICNENVDLFNENFLNKISMFIIYDKQIHYDIVQIVERISFSLTEINRKYQYYIDFLKDLVKYKNEITSLPLVLALKNIIKKKPYFDNNEQSWAYKEIIDFSTSIDYNAQAVSFEICSIIEDQGILNSIMVHSNLKNSIISVICLSNLSDVRLIPVVRALAHFLKVDPLNCSKSYISNKGSEKMLPNFVHFVINGPFDLKVDAGFLLAESMRLNSLVFMYGLSEDLSLLYQSKIGNIKAAILEILNIENQQLLVSMLNGLYIVCQECMRQLCVDDIKKVQNEFATSGIFERIDFLKNCDGPENAASLCQMIFDCFEFDE